MISFPYLLIRLAILIVSLVIHEMAHALMSMAFGDKQAAKRVTLNPLKHLDPMGFLLMMLFGFGWAKPVEVDVSCYRNPKMALSYVAFAGPLANLLLGFGAVVLYLMTQMTWLALVAQLNVGLAVFNLLPVPPLDGSKVWLAILPDDLYYRLLQPSTMVSMFLFVLLIVVGTEYMAPIVNTILNSMFEVALYLF